MVAVAHVIKTNSRAAAERGGRWPMKIKVGSDTHKDFVFPTASSGTPTP
jgi:hypothetical protein